MNKSNPPHQYMPEVFAYCIYADSGADYAVYRVAARRGIDRTIAKVDRPADDFPNAGNIRVLLRSLRLQGSFEGNHAIFSIEEDPHFEARHKNSPRGIKYRAVAALPSGIQVVGVPLNIKQADQISDLIRTGFPILGEPTGKAQVLLELNDGTIVGPLAARAVPNSNVYRVEEATLHNPKSAWKSATSLRVVSLDIDSGPHRFVFDSLPEPELAVDLSPAAVSIKRVFQHLVDQKAAEQILSRNKARDLANVLAKIDPPMELKARCQRVLHLLEYYNFAQDEAPEFMRQVMQTPAMQLRVEGEVTATKQQAHEAAEAELKGTREQVKAAKASFKFVQEQKQQAQAELAGIEKCIQDANRRYEETEKDLSQRLQTAVEKARTETADLLATITMLRPFLQSELTVPSAVSAPFQKSIRMSVQWHLQVQPNTLVDFRETYSHLIENLSIIGLKGPGAVRIALSCVAAFAAGQAVSVRGSAASELAEALAISFFGTQWAEINVPVGYAEFSDLATLQPASGDVGGVWLSGANRSCLNAYAGDWIAPYRMGGRRMLRSDPLLVLTLNEGPSALTPTTQFSEIGPVLHTDALRWSSRSPDPLVAGNFKAKFSGSTVDITEEMKLVDETFAVAPNASAQLAARAALPIIFELIQERKEQRNEDDAVREACSLVTAGWIIPAMATAGRDHSVLAKLEAHIGDNNALATTAALWFRATTS